MDNDARAARKQQQQHKQPSKAAFTVFTDTPSSSELQTAKPVLSTSTKAHTSENKENEAPPGNRAPKRSAAAAAAVKAKPGVLGTKANQQSIIAQRDLWGGKKPFSDASPEKPHFKSSAAKDIYSLPGVVAAAKPSTTKPLRDVQPKRMGGAHVNRPNKAPATIAAAAADRRILELTESPLADVTQAYTGRGGFAHSPTMNSRAMLHSEEMPEQSQVTAVQYSPLPMKRRTVPSSSAVRCLR